MPTREPGKHPPHALFGTAHGINDELGQLQRGLNRPSSCCPGGRLVVISFHSLEIAVKDSCAAFERRSAWRDCRWCRPARSRHCDWWTQAARDAGEVASSRARSACCALPKSPRGAA
jgi:16S rRNA C1402 N4-methylase RsmH